MALICIEQLPALPGISAPTQRALTIWIPHNAHGAHHSENRVAAIPNKNAGPQLLQKAKSRRASACVSCPDAKAWLTHWAPTGYPPRKPAIRRDSAPSGIWHSRRIGRKNGIRCPTRDVVSRTEKRKNGNRDGITVLAVQNKKSDPYCRGYACYRICASVHVHHLRRSYACPVQIIPRPS